MIFADTSAIVALLLKADENHIEATKWVRDNQGVEVVTTDYILDEVYTVILSRTSDKPYTIQTINDFKGTGWLSELEFITQRDFEMSEGLFMRYDDKGWSFTDCTCKVVMDRLGITEAFAFDRHFTQFGNILVAPENC